MNNPYIAAAASVTEAGLKSARLGPRFGRLDLQSQLSLLAVAELKTDFSGFANGRVGIVFTASAGSLSTDANFWNSRHAAGGPGPTLFAYTLPSAAVGEIAIHFKLTGPDLCFVGDGRELMREAADKISRGEVDACICVYCEAVTADCGKLISAAPVAAAYAVLVKRGAGIMELPDFDRDIKSLCALISSSKSAG
jgi:3-oxoacyl-(acyl-carrier-protein) synthase